MGASLCPGFFIQRRMGMKGYLTNKQEFLFPDSPLGEPAEKLRLAAAANQRMGIQLLIQADEPITVSVQSDAVRADFYEMLDIPVEYNTGNGVDQGGAMVILPETCPDYAVRKAPFRVYDCMKPTPNRTEPLRQRNEHQALCHHARLHACPEGHRSRNLRASPDGLQRRGNPCLPGDLRHLSGAL